MAFSIGEGIAVAVEGTSVVEAGAGTAAAADAGAAASTATTAGSTTGSMGAVGSTVAKALAASGVSYALSSLFNRSGSIAHPDAQTFLGNGYSSLDPIPVVYGKRRIGGSRAMVQVLSTPQNTNDVLRQVLIWCEGPVNDLKTLYFDSDPATDAVGTPIGIYSGYMSAAHHFGADDQAADANLADLGATATFAGIAYTWMDLGWNPDRFPNGRPTVTVDVEGRKLYDPRSDTTAWSRNPALAIRDYLTDTRYGCGIPEAMIDDDAIGEAADHCDEDVEIPNWRLSALSTAAAVGSDYVVGNVIVLEGGSASIRAEVTVDSIDGSGGVLTFHVTNAGSFTTQATGFTQYSATANGYDPDTGAPITGTGAVFSGATYAQDTQARYVCDGVVNIDERPFTNLGALLSSCRGFMAYTGGQYRLRIDKAETPVSFVLSEQNIVGGWSIQLGGKMNRFNRVKARFFNEDAVWTPDLAIYESAGFLAEDGVGLEQAFELPFTTNVYAAQRMAQLELNRSRYSVQVSLVATIAATCLEVGDVVPVSHATPGWPAGSDPAEGKLFRVVEIELLSNDEVRLTLREYSDDVYTLADLSLMPATPRTSLPDASNVAAPGTPSVLEVLYTTTGSAGVKTKAAISWGASADTWVNRGGYYELEYKLSSSSTWLRVSPLSEPAVELQDLAPGTYDFRVRAVNVAGARSFYSATTSAEMFGLTAAPSDVTNFAVQSYAGQAKFTWAKPSSNSDLDVVQGGRIIVRWSPKVSGASWDYGSLVNPDGFPGDTSIGFGPLLTGTYMAKAMDSSGNVSENEVSFIVTEALIDGLSTLASVVEAPTFSGTKSNVAAVDGGIQLDSTTLIDDMLTLLDDWGAIDWLGGVVATGTYSFASTLDLGSVQTARLFANIDSVAYDVDDLIDSRTDPIDDWGLIDGVVIEDAEAQLFVRVTDDDPAGAPSWGPWHALGLVADYNNRGFDFRLDMATASATHNRFVTTLTVTAKN